MTVDVTDRSAVLAARKLLRQAKKAKGRAAKAAKKQKRWEKKQEIMAKLREKQQLKEQNARQVNTNTNGCWICGEENHRKTECPNRAAQDITKTCFQCRKRGHTSHNCPELMQNNNSNASDTMQSSVCFNCGSTDHTLKNCTKEIVNGGATYATCYICQMTGHLSSQCPQSKTGVYPRGGCCKICQSIYHLAKNCPQGTGTKIQIQTSNEIPRLNRKTVFTTESDDEIETSSKQDQKKNLVQETNIPIVKF